MQKKVWYYEKWVGHHASFPPIQSVKGIQSKGSLLATIQVLRQYVFCFFRPTHPPRQDK